MRDAIRTIAWWLACGFGAGLAPRAPGTAGTVVGVLVYLPLSGLPLPAYLAAVLGLFALGIPVCSHGARRLDREDPGPVVWDEIVGFLVTMTAAPRGWGWVLAGFAAFRVFDILKPWPVSLADRRVHGGLGIMLDDLLAGLYAAATLQAAALVVKAL